MLLSVCLRAMISSSSYQQNFQDLDYFYPMQN